jgi:patatin-related protein
MTSSSSPLKKPEFQQEFRLGLVVYGGISLAIYMNGVCREFYNAVRGRGVYKLIKALTDSDIIVDVISGTSAGGINGVLLSYALTNSDRKTAVDFKNFAEIWRESGDINRLLRKPDQKEVNSLLDGEEYYQNHLAEAFQKAWDQKISAPAQSDHFEDEWFSESEELDLFVTGTDVLGKVSKAFDNTGCIIEVKDHRTVFLLKHRQGRKHPFQPSPVTQQSLVKLCRITSCFPVAFPVVSIELPSPTDRTFGRKGTETLQTDQSLIDPKKDPRIDQQLVRWGTLANRALPQNPPNTGYQLHFVDGGVLDNRPFSYAIEQIYQRTAYRPVNRKLFYIDPSPDQFLGSPKFNQMAKPSIWESALDSLVSMPRYESIANDLNEIKTSNERVRRYKFLRGTAERLAEKVDDDADGKTDDKIKEQHPELNDSDNSEPTPEKIYLRCRLVGLRDRILPLILGIARQNDSQLNQRDLLEKTAQLITQYVADPKKQEDRDRVLHRLSTKIRNLDVDYAQRKHFFLLEKLCQWMDDPVYAQDYKALNKLAQKIKAQLELLIAIQAGLEGMLRSPVVNQAFAQLIKQAETRKAAHEPIYDYLLRLHRFFLDANCLPGFDPDIDRHLNTLEINSPEDVQSSAKISADFFKTLPSSFLPELPDDQSSADPISALISARISGVLAQLRKKTQELQNPPGKLDQPQLGSTHESSPIWGNRYDFDDKENASSILLQVERASEQLICSSGLTTMIQEKRAQDRLLNLFKRFRDIDQSVYAYEYLSDIKAKEQLEIFRISPNDAQIGFSYRKPEDKLAGDQLGAFGGFFKKTWRSNDILWGRLDGLNRIVEAVITPESLEHFCHFLNRQCDIQALTRKEYIDRLVEETLSEATLIEKTELKKVLEQIADSKTRDDWTKQDLIDFQEKLVTAAHRAILKSDLGNVLEDSIADQLNWSQQLVPSKLSKDLKYQRVKIPSSSNSSALQALQKVDELVYRLLNPETRKSIDQYLVKQSKSQTPKQYFAEAFPHSKTSDRQTLIRYLQDFIDVPNNILIQDLYSFLNYLLKVGQAEIQAKDSPSITKGVIQSMNDNVSKVLDHLKESIKPIFSATAGYLDKAITPFAVKELVKTPIQELLNDQEKLEHYFRDQCQVGSENLQENIPPIILEDVLARTGLILRNVLESKPTGAYLKNSSAFQVVKGLLQTFYWWVQARNPKSSLVPASFRPLLALLLPILAIGGVALLVSQLPTLLLVLIVSLALLQLLNSFTSRFKVPKWTASLLVVVVVITLIVVPHFLPDVPIDWAIPFSKLHIVIKK